MTPPVLGLIVGTLAEPITPWLPQMVVAVLAFMALQTIAPMFSVAAIIPALFLAAVALRIGWAGWMMFAMVPAAVVLAAGGVFAIFSESNAEANGYTFVTLLAGSAALHGIIAWFYLRLLQPAAVAPRGI